MDLDALLTGSQAAAIIGRSRQLIHAWHHAGHLPRTENGRYRLRDVLAAERRTRHSPKSHRKPITTHAAA